MSSSMKKIMNLSPCLLKRFQSPHLRHHRSLAIVIERKYSTINDNNTINKSELDFFQKLSARWWDPAGDMKPLHSFNELRVQLIREGVLQATNSPEVITRSPKPLKDLRILDIGCGGGILSEPLARLGAIVVGLDPVEDCIKVAKEHAAKDESLFPNLTYVCDSIENHVANNTGLYDAVIASEVAEHVDNVDLFFKTCIKLAKVHGSIFVTTINRTYLSWLLAIIVAENVLKVVPKGTHQYEKLLPPHELEALFNTNGCHVNRVHGIVYNPVGDRWHWVDNTSVNYALQAVKVEENKS